MEPIELSRWEPSPEDPRRKQYAGQRTAQEVFEELRHRLEGMGYLPDEYFLMNRDWENGREIPRGADIFCTTDYGGSEGIYLDVSLQWYENDRTVTRNFITGKTLGETGADLDRMFLISSAITKAFHGDRGTYARYLSCGEQPERQEQAMSQTEQLLRRMTGSITAYMEEVGQRPLRMSDYDKTVLAIQDGELTEFWARYPKALDQADSLLVETAGRPGAVGRRMTLSILSAATKISPSAYLTACKRAVDTGDGQRVQSLIEQAESCLSEPLPALTGVAILHAYTNGHRNMAKDLIAQCTSEQIAAAPPNLLRLVAERLDFQTAMELVDKGVQPGDYAADVLHTLTGQHQEWMAEKLLEHGMPVAADNYAALYVCVNNQAAGVAKLLLDRGMDLEQYQTWAEKQRKNEGYEETMAELTEYWSELQSGPEQDSPSMDGMSL